MDWREMMRDERFPRAGKYDPEWVVRDQMGPSALWLTEWLCEKMDLRPGMRVLDLGCGRALSSIFLAREFGVTVFAADLWIAAADNWSRIQRAGEGSRVFPFQVESRSLPFAPGFFDAIVAIDSYQYFGTDDLYLSYLSRFLTDEGRLGIVAPGLTAEFVAGVPEHLTREQANGAVFWEPDCVTFHTASWWREHWAKTGLVDIEVVDTLEDGCQLWARQEHAMEAAGGSVFPSMAETLEADAGRYLGFVRAVARPIRAEGMDRAMPHVWEPAFQAVCAELLKGRDEGKGGA